MPYIRDMGDERKESGMMKLKQIEKKADELTKVYSVPPIPVCEIIQRSGVRLYTTDFGKASDVFSGFCDFVKGRILLNQDDTPLRQYFAAAHEFGHWVLHKDKFESGENKYAFLPRQGVVSDNEEDDCMEKEADFFAENLIMPTRLIKLFSHYSPPELASIFNVERALIEERIKSV